MLACCAVSMGGLTPIELSAVVSSKPFGDRLVECSRFTADNDLEAGFAVYRRRGRITYSEVLHPDDEYLEATEDLENKAASLTPEERVQFIVDMLHASDDPRGRLPELDLGRIITDNNVILRTDLAVVAHEHPLTHLGRRNPNIFRWPYITDLKNYGEHLPSNPGLIEATSVTHQKLGGISLMMWRAENPGAAQRLQNLERSTTVNEELMTQLGLKTIVLTFDRGDGRVLNGVDKIPDLYPAP